MEVPNDKINLVKNDIIVCLTSIKKKQKSYKKKKVKKVKIEDFEVKNAI